MKILTLTFTVLCLLLLPNRGHAADPFYTDINTQMTAQGLPAGTLTTGNTEDAVLSSVALLQMSGQASKDVVAFAGLPFKKGLRLESLAPPDHPWQLFAQELCAGPWTQGDTGLLVFSVHASSMGTTSLEATIKGGDEPHPAFVTAPLAPTTEWTTVYLPFTVPATMSKANLRFLFGNQLQALEIGGIAVFNFGNTVKLGALEAAIAKLPTDLKSSDNGTNPATGTPITTTSPVAIRPSGVDVPRFPFLTPWDDAKANFVDVSGLNDGPAGSHGFIVVKDGHFIEGDTGRRIRFFGTNLSFEGLYPSHEEAEQVAAHFAKYGINAVRLHHQDNTFKWVKPEGRLWDPKFPDHRHINPEQLDKMDYLAAQLEKHGIYIDMCLHVSRTFTSADGFPEAVSKLPPASDPWALFDKRVDEFDPQMIAVDKEYFHDLLSHVNPYTGKSYATDPGLLNVEINNENSLMGLYGETPGADLTGWPDPYGKELADLWNSWLVKKYGTTEKLLAAWNMTGQLASPNLYPSSGDPAKWTLETKPGTTASLTRDDGGLRVDVTKVDSAEDHVQLYQKGLGMLKNGTTYTLTMDMKADKNCSLQVSSHRDSGGPNAPKLDESAPIPVLNTQPDQSHSEDLGLVGQVQITSAWSTCTLQFTAKNAEDGHNRLPVLMLGAANGSTWIRHITLKEADATAAAQTLEAGTVRLATLGEMKQPQQQADWLSFLADTEEGYADSMRSYLRNDLGVKQAIFCSTVGFGGLWSNYREAKSDIVDHHGYWEIHGALTDPIHNQPMVRALGVHDPLTRIAQEKNAGQPTSVTEYNDCFPNEYRAETMPDYASFAAFQDWDAIYLFLFENYGALGQRAGGTDRIIGAFNGSSDPAIWGFMSSAALMFRGNLVPVAPAVQTLGLPAEFPAAQVAAGLTGAKAWKDANVPLTAPFKYRVQLGIGLPNATPDSASPEGVIQVQTSDPKTARYVVDAPATKVVTGFVGGQTISLTGATFAFGDLTNSFGALTLCAMDSQPLAQSSRMLLTLVTHSQNTGQVWNAARTLLANVGDGPPQVDEASATVSITADGPRTVFTLDATGEKQDVVPSTYKDGQVSFAITPAQKSIWYAITKPPISP